MTRRRDDQQGDARGTVLLVLAVAVVLVAESQGAEPPEPVAEAALAVDAAVTRYLLDVLAVLAGSMGLPQP